MCVPLFVYRADTRDSNQIITVGLGNVSSADCYSFCADNLISLRTLAGALCGIDSNHENKQTAHFCPRVCLLVHVFLSLL